jgi:hypothetical protein
LGLLIRARWQIFEVLSGTQKDRPVLRAQRRLQIEPRSMSHSWWIRKTVVLLPESLDQLLTLNVGHAFSTERPAHTSRLD